MLVTAGCAAAILVLPQCDGRITVFELPGVATSAGVSVPPVDAAIVDAGTGDARVEPPTACDDPRPLALDGEASARKPGTGGIDVYAFHQVADGGIFVVVEADIVPELRLLSSCSVKSTDSAIVARPALGGAIVHGSLAKGDWFLAVDWKRSGAAADYKLRASSYVPAPACADAAQWTPTTALTGDVVTASDVTRGCEPDGELGTLFYSVTLAAGTQWSIQLQPKGNWRGKLQAIASCTSTSCTTTPQVSSSPSEPATLLATGAGKLVLGVSSVDPLEAGSFDLVARKLADCTGQGTACGTSGGICCGGKCQPPSTTNKCGTSCTSACATGAHATPTCRGSTCAFTCDANWSQCTDDTTKACQYKVDGGDAQHCGASCEDCTKRARLPNSTGWQCVSGTCKPVCDATKACLVGNACVSTQSDVANCGACGNDCSADPNLGIWDIPVCRAGQCAIECMDGFCPSIFDGHCSFWDDYGCGANCIECKAESWAENGRTTCTLAPKSGGAAGCCAGNIFNGGAEQCNR